MLEVERWEYGSPRTIIVMEMEFELGKRKSKDKPSPRLLDHDEVGSLGSKVLAMRAVGVNDSLVSSARILGLFHNISSRGRTSFSRRMRSGLRS